MIPKLTLINDDCLNALKALESGSVDCCITDLPYGITQNERDKKIPLSPLWKELRRVVKPNGAIALFCQGAFFVELVNSNPKMFRYDIVWDKVLTSGFLNAKRQPLRRHEQIAVFYKKQPTYNPQFTTGKPLHGKGTAYLRKSQTNNNYGDYSPIPETRKGACEKYPTSIVQIQKPHPSIATHITQKPVALFEWLIKTYSNAGDTVLDCCMGGGGCGIAAINLGRSFIGIEKYEDTFAAAQEIISRETENESVVS